MLKPDQPVIRIQEEVRQTKLSPAQKKFNSLIKRIEQQKQLLAVWQETIPLLTKLAAEKLAPLLATYNGHKVEMVELLDRQYAEKCFSRNQKEKIAYLLLDLCAELIQGGDRDDLKALYNKYSEIDFDTEAQEEESINNDLMKAIIKDSFGIDLDDEEIDPNNPEKMAARMREKLEAQQQQAAAQASKRKKSAKQLQREAAQKEEEVNIGKSIREVYRQLVTDLHPDREQDPVERQRKTELMQRVTVAYKKKDLMQLLELQLEVEQIDQEHINNIAADRLKHFNKILQGQLDQLQQELEQVEAPIKAQLGLAFYQRVRPQDAIQNLRLEAVKLQQEIQGIKHDLLCFKDAKKLKAWLKDYHIDKEPDDWPFGGPGFRF